MSVGEAHTDIQSPRETEKTQFLALDMIQILHHVPGAYVRTQPSKDLIID